MNEQSSRWLDRLVGIPLCWLLTVWRRLFERQQPPAAPRRILFVKLAEMGAIVLTVPAFEAAIRRVGRENLFIVMLAGNRGVHDLLRVFPDSNIFTIRDRNLFTFAQDTLALLRTCRRLGIDTVIDLEGFARISAVLSYLTGARLRVGLHRFTVEGLYRGDLFTHRLACNYYQHASLQFLAMVEALDHDPAELPMLKSRTELVDYRLPLFEPTPTERDDVQKMITERCGGLPSHPWIVLNCNLADLLPLRRWPRERFLELGRRVLAENPQATLLLTGLAIERQASIELAREISSDHAFSLAGDTRDLRQLVTLFTQCELLVTSDCGPGHMAAVTEMPILSIFGPETPQLYAPLSPHNTSLWAGLGCSPCLNVFNQRRSSCKNNVCMQEISVGRVMHEVRLRCRNWQESAKIDPASV